MSLPPRPVFRRVSSARPLSAFLLRAPTSRVSPAVPRPASHCFPSPSSTSAALLPISPEFSLLPVAVGVDSPFLRWYL
jgi:hypothetical protein